MTAPIPGLQPALPHQRSPRYRPEVDGLRALAVVAVILFHFGVEACAGGFVGVDVFFVISGYLITQKLLAAHERGGISFREFYASRIRRLLPALYTTLFAVTLASIVWMPLEVLRVGTSMLAALSWVANVFFWTEAGYWDPGWQTKPLLHTWSLSVEEQFYLVWPASCWRCCDSGRAGRSSPSSASSERSAWAPAPG